MAPGGHRTYGDRDSARLRPDPAPHPLKTTSSAELVRNAG